MNGTLDRLAPTLFSRLHMLMDLLVVTTMVLSLDYPPQMTGFLFVLSAAVSLVWLTASAGLRAYQTAVRPNVDDQASVWTAQSVVACAIALGVCALLGGSLPASAALFSTVAALAFTRLVMVKVESLVGLPSRQVLIVGAGPLARTLAEHLERGRSLSRVVGFIPLDGETPPGGLVKRVVGEAGSLAHVLANVAVEEVYVAGNAVRQSESMQQAVNVCEELGMPFALPVHALTLERATPVHLDPRDLGFIHHISSDPRPVARGVKRLFDIVSSGFALLMLSPLLITMAIVIKLTSQGPILFRQKRVGMHGRPFQMLKFRSMVVNAEELQAKLEALNEQTGPVFKIRHDPRITGIGRFIRRYSVDELPQLINILRGDMSVVGPRPPVPSEVVKYEPWQRRRLSVRPGLTCHWQVSGRNNISFEQWMILDLRYIDQWTFYTDLKLIARTIPAVFTGHGAS